MQRQIGEPSSDGYPRLRQAETAALDQLDAAFCALSSNQNCSDLLTPPPIGVLITVQPGD